jgi:hypothetical protein
LQNDSGINILKRGSSYCEWLFGDNCVGFYNCSNQQLLDLAKLASMKLRQLKYAAPTHTVSGSMEIIGQDTNLGWPGRRLVFGLPN